MNRRTFAIHGSLAGAGLLASPAALLATPPGATTGKLMMLSVAVSDMPKAKAFYADTLGLKVTKDYRVDDHNWWVSVAFPDGGASITLTTFQENMKPGTMKLYFTTRDVAASHKDLGDKGAKAGEVKNDLFGPGSGVKWLQLADPDGNQVLLVETH